jgi:hypothetical protein
MPYPNLRLVGVGCHPHRLPEDTTQVVYAEPGVPGQGLQSYVLGRVLLQVLPTQSDGGGFPAGRSGRARRCRMPTDQQDEGLDEVLVLFEQARLGALGEVVETPQSSRDLRIPHDVATESWRRGPAFGKLRHDATDEIRVG